jgi:hypothetical protein
MLAPESTFWICLGKCAHWLLEIQDSRNRLDSCVLVEATSSRHDWLLLREQIAKDILSPLPELEALMRI